MIYTHGRGFDLKIKKKVEHSFQTLSLWFGTELLSSTICSFFKTSQDIFHLVFWRYFTSERRYSVLNLVCTEKLRQTCDKISVYSHAIKPLVKSNMVDTNRTDNWRSAVCIWCVCKKSKILDISPVAFYSFHGLLLLFTKQCNLKWMRGSFGQKLRDWLNLHHLRAGL